jgi:hypothetical protein
MADTALRRVLTAMADHENLDPTTLPYLPGREPRAKSKGKGKDKGKGKGENKGATSPRAGPLSARCVCMCSGGRGSLRECMERGRPLDCVAVNVNELRLGFSNTTRNPEGILSHSNTVRRWNCIAHSLAREACTMMN